MGKLCAMLVFAFRAFAADPALLNLVMPDVKVVAGLQVEQAKVSPFGRYVLGHMEPDDAAWKDILRQITEIVIASNADADITEHWLVLARGAFHPESNTQPGIAFPDDSIAVIGEPDLVKTAMERFHNHAIAGAPLLDKVKMVSPRNDFWFVSLVPLSFSNFMPENLKESTALDTITQALGGAKFGADVQLSAELTTRNSQDAEDMGNALRFFAALIQTNRNGGGSLLDTLTLSTKGDLVTLSLSIPEQLLEKLITPDSGKAAVRGRRSNERFAVDESIDASHSRGIDRPGTPGQR